MSAPPRPDPDDLVPSSAASTGAAQLHVHHELEALRLELSGELDLNTVTLIRPLFFEHLDAVAAGALIVYARPVTYLSSAGVDLLAAAAYAAPDGCQAGPVARILGLTGLDRHLPVSP